MEPLVSNLPATRILGQGGYGSVYSVKSDNVVVKKQITNLYNLVVLNEIDIMRRLQHPCIGNLLEFQIHNISRESAEVLYLLQKGYNIDNVDLSTRLYTSPSGSTLSLKEIAFDMISAVSFMHQHGIAHLDIKNENTIFLEGDDDYPSRAALIDFGLSKHCFEHKINLPDGTSYKDYVFESVAFTLDHRDPEVVNHRQNSIKQDLHAIAVSLWYWFTKGRKVFSSVDSEKMFFVENQAELYLPLAKNEDERNFCFLIMELSRHPVQIRLSAQEILDNSPYFDDIRSKRRWRGLEMATTSTPPKDTCYPIYNEMINLIYAVFEKNFMAKSLFLAVNIFQRSLFGVHPNLDKYSKGSKEYERLEMFTIACCAMGSMADINNVEGWTLYPPYVAKKVINTELIAVYYDEFVKIIYYLHGIIYSKTPFDFANSWRDLPNMFIDMVSCTFKPGVVRQWVATTSNEENYDNLNVTSKWLLSQIKDHKFSVEEGSETLVKITKIPEFFDIITKDIGDHVIKILRNVSVDDDLKFTIYSFVYRYRNVIGRNKYTKEIWDIIERWRGVLYKDERKIIDESRLFKFASIDAIYHDKNVDKSVNPVITDDYDTPYG